MEWIPVTSRKPKHNQYIIALGSLVFDGYRIGVGHYMRGRKGLPGRIQYHGGKGSFYSYSSLNDYHYWIPIECLKEVKFPSQPDRSKREDSLSVRYGALNIVETQ